MQISAKQACKIWCKNIHALLRYHTLGVGTFELYPLPCRLSLYRHSLKLESWYKLVMYMILIGDCLLYVTGCNAAYKAVNRLILFS